MGTGKPIPPGNQAAQPPGLNADEREGLRGEARGALACRFRQWFGRIVLVALLCLAGGAARTTAQPAPQPAHLILHMLDYIAVDYPEFVQDGVVLDEAEYDEQLDFSRQVLDSLGHLPAPAERPELLRLAEQLLDRIQHKAPGLEVAALAQELRWSIIRAYAIEIAPKRPPDLRLAASLYQTQCAACHGTQGQGDGPAGANLEPAPSNFHDRQRMGQRSVYSLYSTITLGVQGTGMAGFQTLSEEERWALAFYVGQFPSPVADVQRGADLWRAGIGRSWFPDLASIVTQTVSGARTTHGDEAPLIMAYLLHHPEAVVPTTEAPLARSSRLVGDSLAAYTQGQVQRARDLAVSAYLDGFELTEASLDAVDRRLRISIEAEMMRYRSLLQSQADVSTLTAAAERLQGLLSDARQVLETTRLPTSAVFLSAFVILLREGLEAILILAAIYALLIKAKRRDALPYVHAGWVAALALGGITWVVASYVMTIGGATREVTEGVTALVAAAVLLYVGFWMHDKAYAERWRSFLADQIQGALSSRTMWALASVSFLAVYREAFETVLFYQALWVQVAPRYLPMLGGIVSAAAALIILGWLIFRGSVKLPLGVFFGVTSWLLAILAIVFAGQGIAALQEAGRLPIAAVDFPSVPALGLYPTLQGLGVQAVLLLLVAGVFLYTRYRTAAMR
jgi:high-affinity iron transporter